MDAVKEMLPADLMSYTVMPFEAMAKFARSEVLPLVEGKSPVWLASAGIVTGTSAYVTFNVIKGYVKVSCSNYRAERAWNVESSCDYFIHSVGTPTRRSLGIANASKGTRNNSAPA